MPNGTWVAEAAEMVKAIGGRAPVHMVMTREDDVKGGFYRPQALHKVRAGIDAQGRILGWEHRVVGQSIFAGTPFEANELKGGVDSALVEGVRDTLYGLDQFTVEARIAQSPVPVLWFRSVGNSHTAHVMETMMDALAQAAGHDPVEYRLGLLAKDKRAAAVVKLAAEKAGWGEKLPPGRGRGFAFHHCFNTRVAMVADVTVTAGKLRVDRVVAAVDCGVPINPDVITAQVEGAVGFALGTVLRNRITMTDGAVEQGNFDDYEPARIHEMPRVEVHIVPSTEHPTGIGEPGVAPLAPAIGNAVFAATGKRSWGLPVVV
jgi:isoquinoline 1-oxidoreductase beta subunit